MRPLALVMAEMLQLLEELLDVMASLDIGELDVDAEKDETVSVYLVCWSLVTAL